jgi:hypothetical protein
MYGMGDFMKTMIMLFKSFKKYNDQVIRNQVILFWVE